MRAYDPWPALIAGVQMFSALAWLTVAHHYWPATWRIMRGQSKSGWDVAGCWVWCMGMLETAIVIWWMAYGTGIMDDLSQGAVITRVMLWRMSALLAVGILHTRRVPDFGMALRRARQGVGMWLGVGLACVAVSLWFR